MVQNVEGSIPFAHPILHIMDTPILRPSPPCPCSWCNDWIEETDFFYRDPFSGKPICIACWDFMPDETKGNIFPGLDSGDGFG